MSLLEPLVDLAKSDSANLDAVFESYIRSGRSPLEALMMLVPEAFHNQVFLT
jgi:glutamate synthase (ferredoxin)